MPQSPPLFLILLTQLGAILSWLILCATVVLVSVWGTGMIPFAGVGIILAVTGSLFHVVLIALNRRAVWWQAGLVLGCISCVNSLTVGFRESDRYAAGFVLFFFSFYFIFSSLIYAVVQKYVVEFLLTEE